MRLPALDTISRTAVQRYNEPAPIVDAASEHVVRRLGRCECRSCGAHCNAIASGTIETSCPNCGASGLVPVEGAGLIEPAES
jgi:Zn finger protein HypA/HybF involved in hydrogenase expression